MLLHIPLVILCPSWAQFSNLPRQILERILIIGKLKKEVKFLKHLKNNFRKILGKRLGKY